MEVGIFEGIRCANSYHETLPASVFMNFELFNFELRTDLKVNPSEPNVEPYEGAKR